MRAVSAPATGSGSLGRAFIARQITSASGGEFARLLAGFGGRAAVYPVRKSFGLRKHVVLAVARHSDCFLCLPSSLL